MDDATSVGNPPKKLGLPSKILAAACALGIVAYAGTTIIFVCIQPEVNKQLRARDLRIDVDNLKVTVTQEQFNFAIAPNVTNGSKYEPKSVSELQHFFRNVERFVRLESSFRVHRLRTALATGSSNGSEIAKRLLTRVDNLDAVPWHENSHDGQSSGLTWFLECRHFSMEQEQPAGLTFIEPNLYNSWATVLTPFGTESDSTTNAMNAVDALRICYGAKLITDPRATGEWRTYLTGGFNGNDVGILLQASGTLLLHGYDRLAEIVLLQIEPKVASEELFLIRKATQYIRSGYWRHGESLLRTALSDDPTKNEEARIQLAVVLVYQGKFAKAVEAFEKLAPTARSRPSALQPYVYSLVQCNRIDDARRKINDVRRRYDLERAEGNLLGWICAADRAKAQKYYESVLRRDPDNIFACLRMARLKTQLGHSRQVLELLYRVVQSGTTSRDMLTGLPKMLEKVASDVWNDWYKKKCKTESKDTVELLACFRLAGLEQWTDLESLAKKVYERKSVYKKVISCITQASSHEVDHREIDHCLARVSQSFIVFAETPIPSQPSEGAFDDPAVRKYFEASHVVAPPDDFQYPPAELVNPVNQHARIPTISPDQL